MDLTEAQDTKKRWQEYTEELYKKDLHYPDNHDGVITHLEPDILECEVRWALESFTLNKASGPRGICEHCPWASATPQLQTHLMMAQTSPARFLRQAVDAIWELVDGDPSYSPSLGQSVTSTASRKM